MWWMIQLAQDVYVKNIGSHVMKTHKNDSTYYQGVVNRVNHEQNDSSLGLPLDINSDEIEYEQKKKQYKKSNKNPYEIGNIVR